MATTTRDEVPAAATRHMPPGGAPDGFRPSPSGRAARLAALAAILGGVLAVPLLLDDVVLNVASTAAVYMIVALSMNVLLGYTGQVSLGHAAFVGVGAFTTGYVVTEQALPWLVAVALSTATGAAAALILGFIALRIRGLYLALVTIAYALFAQEVIFNIRALTRGGAGMPAPRPSFATGDLAYVYVCLAGVALAWLLDWRLTSSKAGRAIRALRDDERVAASWGVDVTAYKLLAFVVSGMMAGLAGGLLASVEQIVVAISFRLEVSLLFLLMTVVGGVGVRSGVVQGGALFAVIGTLLAAAEDNLSWWPFGSQWESVIAALLLLLTLLLYPGGIAQLQAPIRRWLGFGPLRAPPGGGGAS